VLSEADERRLSKRRNRIARIGAVYEKYFEVVYGYCRCATARPLKTRPAKCRKALAHLPRFKWTGALWGLVVENCGT
jgi:hypothetical protein